MLRLLLDENFHGDIERGLRRQEPSIDMVRVQDVGLSGADDPEILSWSAAQDRILVTHDRKTIPKFAYQRINGGEAMPGVLVVRDDAAIGAAIEEILAWTLCARSEDCLDQVLFLP